MTLYRVLNHGTAYGRFTVGKVYMGEALGIADDEQYLSVCIKPEGELPRQTVHDGIFPLGIRSVVGFCNRWIKFLLGPVGKDLADVEALISAALAELQRAVDAMPNAPLRQNLTPHGAADGP